MKDLTKGNICKTFFLFGFPCVLSGLLSQRYGIIDTAIAGKFLAIEATLCFALYFIGRWKPKQTE